MSGLVLVRLWFRCVLGGLSLLDLRSDGHAIPTDLLLFCYRCCCAMRSTLWCLGSLDLALLLRALWFGSNKESELGSSLDVCPRLLDALEIDLLECVEFTPRVSIHSNCVLVCLVRR